MDAYYKGKKVIATLDQCVCNIKNEENNNLFEKDANSCQHTQLFSEIQKNNNNTPWNEEYQG